MSRTTQTIAIIISYTVVILGTLVWSGRTVEKTLYDKYIIYLEGAIMPVSKEGRSVDFYGEVLNFNQVPSKKLRQFGKRAFLITQKKRLYLQPENGEPHYGPVLLVRVRNGFDKLHAELLRRYPGSPQQIDPKQAIQQIRAGHVSQVFRGKRSDQFIVSDPDNNRILFYRHKLRLFG